MKCVEHVCYLPDQKLQIQVGPHDSAIAMDTTDLGKQHTVLLQPKTRKWSNSPGNTLLMWNSKLSGIPMHSNNFAFTEYQPQACSTCLSLAAPLSIVTAWPLLVTHLEESVFIHITCAYLQNSASSVRCRGAAPAWLLGNCKTSCPSTAYQ